MKSLIITVFVILSFVSITKAQTPKESITENGVVFTRIKTISELTAIGYTVTGNSAMNKGHRAKPNYTCGIIKGGCYCDGIVVSSGQITTCNFPTQTPDGGESVPGINGVLPYYNSTVGVIFRQ